MSTKFGPSALHHRKMSQISRAFPPVTIRLDRTVAANALVPFGGTGIRSARSGR